MMASQPGARSRRFSTSDVRSLVLEELAAYEEEARLDEELDAARREIASLRLSVSTVANVAWSSHAWARRARERAATHIVQPVGMSPSLVPPTALSAGTRRSGSRAPEPEPEPEPQPQLEPPVHILPPPEVDEEDAPPPDWALSSERVSAEDLTRERIDVAKAVVEQGQVEAVYENQRRSLLGGGEDFSAQHLVPGTRGPWSDVSGVRAERGRLPQGWHWAVEHGQGRTDPEGWEYAFHFRATWFAEAERPGSFGGAAWVRRRKWVPTQNARTAVQLKRAIPAGDAAAGGRTAPTYRCILEVWEARALSFVVDGVPDNVSVQGVPPSAVFRIRVGHHCHQSAARPPSSNPQWGDETNSARCRRAFRIATPADILAESEEDDDLGRLARHFAGPTGVKVRDRSYLPAMTTHEQSFTGKKAIDWLTGVHSRGYHGSGLVATRDEARVLAQEMMNRGIFHDSTRNVSAQRRKVPPPMPPAPSPDGWVERVMADGDVYYVNRDTGEKSWTPPGPEAAKAPPRPVFRDSSSAFYRFDAEWLAAKSRQSKIMLRRKTLERRESMRQTRSGTTLDVDVAVCDEVVIELLDAELAARLGPTDDVLPEQLLGSVAIPLHTICQHEGSEGWHNLQGPGVVTGELRVGWLMLEDDTSPSEIAERLQRPAGFVDSQCPSPKHQLKVQSAAEAATATAAATTTRRERALLGNVSLGLQLHDSTGTGKGDDLAGEDGTPVSSGAQAAACCRMAQSYIDVGELGPAQACLSAGLGLVRTADRAVLLEMQEYLARCAAIANTQGGQIGSWTPLFRRQASGDYRVSHHTQYDRQAPWVEWRGTRHDESGGFCDVLGFVVPPVSARSWRLAHSHSLCVSARHRPRWATLIPPSAFGSNGSGRLPTPDASRPTPPRWTGWGPGSQDADAVAELVMQHGVPPELRRLVWPALLGATARQEQALRGGQGDLYLSLVARYTEAGEHRKQIRKDIHRTLPGQCTVVNSPEGAECLERVLGAFSEYDRWYGYTQSLNMVAAHLLVVLSLEAEEDVFWMLAQIVEVVVPEYYSSELFGMNADAVVLNMLAEHWVYTTQARIAEVGVPITLVASRWLLPLCAEILPPSTLYRLWDLLFLTRSAVPLHAAALTIMRGAHADSFWDFEGAMRVLTHGASAAYDSQPFIEHVTGYMALFPESDLAAQHYSCLVNGYVDDDGIPMVVSPLDGLAARLPGFEEALQTAWLGPGYGWDAPARIELDRWQIFRLATPFAEELEHEAAAAEEAASSAEDEHGALTISVDGAIEALGGLLPGLRQRPELLERFVRRVLVMPPNGPHHHSAAASTGAAEERVTLACWLNTLMALQPQASESLARWSVWWRFCGGGRVGGGRIRDGAKGATMDEVTEAICAVYSAIAGPGGDDDRSLPTEAAVRGSVNAFYTQRDKSWVKRSAKKHGLGRRSTARMVALHHRLVYEALDWDSPLCLGVRIPPRKPPPPTRSSRATFL